jgi:hypothetical protein
MRGAAFFRKPGWRSVKQTSAETPILNPTCYGETLFDRRYADSWLARLASSLAWGLNRQYENIAEHHGFDSYVRSA